MKSCSYAEPLAAGSQEGLGSAIGFPAFQSTDPPKRYLTHLGSETFSGGNPESGPVGFPKAGSVTIDPVTGQQTPNGDGMVGGGDVQSPLRKQGSFSIYSYDDPPNQETDNQASVQTMALLSQENTTQMMVDNGKSKLEAFEDDFQPGTPFAYRNVHENELAFDYRKVQFKFKWQDGVTEEQRHAVTYLVLFQPENDPETPENESVENAEVIETIQWDGQAPESTPPIVIDPDERKPGEDGTYAVYPIEIRVMKQGSQPPVDGLVVLTGETLVIEASPVADAAWPLKRDDLVWSYQQMNGNRQWTGWAPFGETGRGVRFTHTTVLGGIYRVKVDVEGAGAFQLLRKRDEAVGEPPVLYGQRKGQPDAVGVADGPVQIALRNEAKNYYASTAYRFEDAIPAAYGWPAVDEDKNKCNIFVAHRIRAAGLILPPINGHLADNPPLANEWAGVEDTEIVPGDPTYIFNWRLLPEETYPQPGWVIAFPNPPGSGHVGVVDYDGEGIATGTLSGIVYKAYGFFGSRLRQYDPTF